MKLKTLLNNLLHRQQPVQLTPTFNTSTASLSAYNRYYRIGNLVVLNLNFNVIATAAGTIYMSNLPIPRGNSAFGMATTGGGSRFYVDTNGNLRADGATKTGYYNGCVCYVCK